MTNTNLDDRVAQLEKIVATQSEMILKLVEMVNHLGTESAALGERLERVQVATGAQLEKVAGMLQRLAGEFGGEAEAN
ncbi:hypothetical protein [Anatilimnocola floriformis]|uniref:hypothetical protein n=1 Tax=Anatilimnocola floriformis TaxID=2948575 RepID=UPI0020C37BAE|nr:hypothetical protein [Anatilimnocola floriformis]